MSSQKPPPRYPCKFLMRALKVGNQDAATYRMANVKRFFFKKLMDTRQSDDFYGTDYWLISHVFKNGKYLKTVHRAHVSSLLKPYVHHHLKMSKSIKSYGFSFENDDNTSYKIVYSLKRLHRNLQKINIEVFTLDQIPQADLYNIARCIRRFPKLQSFIRDYSYETDENKSPIPRELQLFHQSASRLKDLTTIMYKIMPDEQAGLQRAMRRGCVFPGITGLDLALAARSLAHYEDFLGFFWPENSLYDLNYEFNFDKMTLDQKRIYQRIKDDTKREDEEKNDDLRGVTRIADIPPEADSDNEPVVSNDDVGIGEEFEAKCIMREEIKPFFRFELFPNLKYLSLRHTLHLYPLGSFVIDGFKKLSNLESLKIDIEERSEGTNHLFRGFLHLPLLKKFSLNIGFITGLDWILLEEFIREQNSLESLRIRTRHEPSTRIRYLSQNDHLEKIIKGLENKPRLKSLDLQSKFWSLETLSKGLSHLGTMTNQLHTFKFEGSDETVTSDQKLWKRVEGLCNFIKNQKESLRKLHVFLPLAFEEKLVIHIAEAFSKVTCLTDLVLEVNSSSAESVQLLIPYYEKTLQECMSQSDQRKFPSERNWNPNIGKYLKRLQDLENLTLGFWSVNPNQRDSVKWVKEIMEALPSLERLKRLEVVGYESGELENGDQKIIDMLRDLKSIKEINIELQNATSAQLIGDAALAEIRQKQAAKSYLNF